MGIIREMQRTHARQVRAQQRAQAAAYRQYQQMRREAERAYKAAQQASAANERERKRLYAEARVAEVAADNADLQARLDELDTLLATTLAVDDHIDLDRLKKRATHPPFNPGNLGTPLPPPDWGRFQPAAPTGLNKMFGGKAKYQQQLVAAQQAFEQSRAQHAAAETERQRRLATAHEQYEQQCQKVEAQISAHNAEIDWFAAAFAAAEPNAVVEYFGMVLGNSVYPDDFPQLSNIGLRTYRSRDSSSWNTTFRRWTSFPPCASTATSSRVTR